MGKLDTFAKRLWSEESGATMLEYMLVLILIMVVCVTFITSIGNITNSFYNVANTL